MVLGVRRERLHPRLAERRGRHVGQHDGVEGVERLRVRRHGLGRRDLHRESIRRERLPEVLAGVGRALDDEHARTRLHADRRHEAVVVGERVAVGRDLGSERRRTLLRDAHRERHDVLAGHECDLALAEHARTAEQLHARTPRGLRLHADGHACRFVAPQFRRQVDARDPDIAAWTHERRHREHAHAAGTQAVERAPRIAARRIAVGHQDDALQGVRLEGARDGFECALDVGHERIERVGRPDAARAQRHVADRFRGIDEAGAIGEGDEAGRRDAVLGARLVHPADRGVDERRVDTLRDIQRVHDRDVGGFAEPRRTHQRDRNARDRGGAQRTEHDAMPRRQRRQRVACEPDDERQRHDERDDRPPSLDDEPGHTVTRR